MPPRTSFPFGARVVVVLLLVAGPLALTLLRQPPPLPAPSSSTAPAPAPSPSAPDTAPANPFADLYRPHRTRWTELRPGAHISAPVGLGSRFAQLWSASDRTHGAAVGGDGLRRDGRPWWTLPARTPPPGTPRLLVLGDSFAFGFFVDDHQTFSARLARRPTPAPVEVLNAGVPGYSAAQGLLYLRELLPSTNPDAVAIAFGTNDARDAATRWPTDLARLDDGVLLEALRRRLAEPEGEAAWRSDPFAVVRDLRPGPLEPLRRTWIYRTLRDPLVSLKRELIERLDSADRAAPPVPGAALGAVRRVSLPQYEAALHTMVGLVRNTGAEPILIAATLEPDYRAALLRTAAERGAALLDVRALFADARAAGRGGPGGPFAAHWARLERDLGPEVLRAHPWLDSSIDGVHPNPVGHELIAGALHALFWEVDPAGRTRAGDGVAQAAAQADGPTTATEDRASECWRAIELLSAALGGAPGEPARAAPPLDSLLAQLERDCPDHAAAHLVAGAALLRTGRPAAAATRLRAALAGLPWPGRAHIALARALQRAGRPDEALEPLRAVVRRAPDTPLAAEAIELLPHDLDPDGRYEHEAGHAYLFELHPGLAAVPAGAASELVLLEEGIPLPAPQALHADIRAQGAGRYSHWGVVIYFAASDGSDPNDNGRDYRVERRHAPGSPPESPR